MGKNGIVRNNTTQQWKILVAVAASSLPFYGGSTDGRQPVKILPVLS